MKRFLITIWVLIILISTNQSLAGDWSYDDGYIFGDSGFNGKVGTDLSWKLPPCFGKNTTLIFPSVTYYFSSPKIGDQDDNRVVGGGISIKF